MELGETNLPFFHHNAFFVFTLYEYVRLCILLCHMVKINLYGTEILTRYKCRSWLNTQTLPPLISVIRKYIDHDFNILDECTFGNRANFLQDAQIREEERSM